MSGDQPAPSPDPGSAPTPAPAPAPGGSGNAAPVITGGIDGTVAAGAVYTLQPSASDPDGDELTFGAENLPPWASIDPATGKISGTPGSSDVGAYESVSITVADAVHQTATEPFSITVTGAGGSSAVATLKWGQPVSKVDGSPLDDLAGYRIAYGLDPEDLSHSIFVNDPAQTEYEFATLAPGTWYFAIMAVNVYGLEGPPTPPAAKSL